VVGKGEVGKVTVSLNVDRSFCSMSYKGEVIVTGCMCHDDPTSWWLQSKDGNTVRVRDRELRRVFDTRNEASIYDVSAMFARAASP
jgi:nitrogenase subunit NifH